MPNNFKLQGDYYVSKFGNDSWDGLTPDTPKRTIQAALNLFSSGTRTIIIGSGDYSEAILKTGGAGVGVNIYADGIVNIRALLLTSEFVIAISAVVIVGVNFFSFSRININGTLTMTDCSFRNITSIALNTSNAFSSTSNRCVYINSIFTYNYIGTIQNSIFINSISSQLALINCYANSSSIISVGNGSSGGNYNYNNIQGAVINPIATTVTTGTYQDIYGRYYNLSIAGNNTTPDAGTIGNPLYRADTLGRAFSFATHRILYSTFNVNSISEDPKFNDILAQDFTLQSGSPHIGRASDGISNIGGTRYAIRAAANSSSFSGSSATVDTGLTFSYDNYVISGSAVTGSVTSAPIFISSSAKVIQEIDYNGLLAFNKTTSSFFSSGSNVNVPDFDTYTSASGNPGANPDRLVYYMRLTTGSTQPVVDSDWDNGNLWTRGDYNVFEWNTKPSIDVYGRGNGDPNFLVANSSFLRATYIQMKVKLRNDYLQ